MRNVLFYCLLMTFIGIVDSSECIAQDLCSLPSGARGFNASEDTDAYAVLDKIGKIIPFQTRTLMLFQSSSSLVKQRGGAAAEICFGTQRWIFYDPAYIESIKDKNGSNDLARYFVIAHEIAHHINGDTLNEGEWNKEQELAADYSAAVWLTRLGVSRRELLQTFDALQFPVESRNGYPTRAERRASVVAGSLAAGSSTTGPKDELSVWRRYQTLPQAFLASVCRIATLARSKTLFGCSYAARRMAGNRCATKALKVYRLRTTAW